MEEGRDIVEEKVELDMVKGYWWRYTKKEEPVRSH